MEYLVARTSNHNPILLSFNESHSNLRGQMDNKIFRYKAKWQLDEDCTKERRRKNWIKSITDSQDKV